MQQIQKVFINLGVDNLDKEYQRIAELGIGKICPPFDILMFFHHIGILLLWIRMEIQLKLQEHMRNKYYQYIEKAHIQEGR